MPAGRAGRPRSGLDRGSPRSARMWRARCRAPPTRRRSARRPGFSPLPHELDLGNELHPEFLGDLLLDERHQGTDVVGRRPARVDDEVRVLGAHHRAADGPALEASGLDEPAGEVTGRVAEDRSGVGLREWLLLDALVRHLLYPLDGVRTIADLPAEARADADNRRALERAGAIGVAELTDRRGPRVAIQVDELGVDKNVRRLAAERTRIAVDRAADGARHRRHPFESLDAGARRDRGDVCELRAGRGGDDVGVHARLAPRVLEHDAAHAAVGDEQIGSAAEHKHRKLVLARHLDGIEEILLARDAQEEIRGPSDPQRCVWRERFRARAECRHGHAAVSRSRRSSRMRSAMSRVSPAPITKMTSPGSATPTTSRAAVSLSSAYRPQTPSASVRAQPSLSDPSRAEENVTTTTVGIHPPRSQNASSNCSKKAFKRLTVCGWKTASTLFPSGRTASIDARISVGW